jgi:hypothetical protein
VEFFAGVVLLADCPAGESILSVNRFDEGKFRKAGTSFGFQIKNKPPLT